MCETPERILYDGIKSLLHEVDAYLLQIKRWARVSFRLDVVRHGPVIELSLVPCPEFTRCPKLPDSYSLGILVFGARPQTGGKSKMIHKRVASNIPDVARRLLEFIERHETPPLENRTMWEREAWGTPLAIAGIGYLRDVVNERDRRLLPVNLETYRTNDEASERFRSRLQLLVR